MKNAEVDQQSQTTTAPTLPLPKSDLKPTPGLGEFLAKVPVGPESKLDKDGGEWVADVRLSLRPEDWLTISKGAHVNGVTVGEVVEWLLVGGRRRVPPLDSFAENFSMKE